MSPGTSGQRKRDRGRSCHRGCRGRTRSEIPTPKGPYSGKKRTGVVFTRDGGGIHEGEYEFFPLRFGVCDHPHYDFGRLGRACVT